MVERDPFEQRTYQPVVPRDLDDPPQFGQITETVKDAFVLELRQFFDQPRLNVLDAARGREIPTVQKYAVGYGPNTDPYETTQQILSDLADVAEHLPHVAVTAVTGTNNRQTIGQPFIGHVQIPPRVVTATAAPWALGAPAYEVRQVVVNAAVVGQRLAIGIDGTDFEYVVQTGDSTADAARGLALALAGAVPLFRTARTGDTLVITCQTINTAFVLDVAGALTASLVTAAGSSELDVLEFSTRPRGVAEIVERVSFWPERFPTASPPSAATAVDVARVINEQAKWAQAVVVPVGVGSGVRLFTGGPLGGETTPNEIEIRTGTTDNVLALFGFGARGTGGPGATLTGVGADAEPMVLEATGVGAAAQEVIDTGSTPYVTLSGEDLANGNVGHFPISSAPDDDTIEFVNVDGTPESFADQEWFIGARDTWRNPARPVLNRRHLSFRVNVTLSVLTESPNTRDELHDLVLTQFAYYMELKFFELTGRGTLDAENYPNEIYTISIAQDIAPTGASQTQRPGDAKQPIYESRITVPCTLLMYQDRSVLIPSGPRAGELFVTTPDDITGTGTAL